MILLVSACDSFKGPEENTLGHAPEDEVNVLISNTIIKVDFKLDDNLSFITSGTILCKVDKIKTREELISYYKTLTPSFLAGYSSIFDFNHYDFAKVEYLLAQECFQDNCSSQTRRDVLISAVDKQKHKFGIPYVTPSLTRRTGTFLIAVILLKENDNSFVQSLLNNVDLQRTLLCLNNDIWMDDETFNNSLIQYAENFLIKE